MESSCLLSSPCVSEYCVLLQSLWMVRQTPLSGDPWALGPLMQQTHRMEAMLPL